MTDRLLELDRAARRAAQEIFDRPLVLEAGAGTGKTSTLVARILAWTLGPGWERAAAASSDAAEEPEAQATLAAAVLDGTVAITFTEAAAAEMAARIADGLAAVAAQREHEVPGLELDAATAAAPEARSRRAAALLGHLDHLEVATIHAFCHRRLVAHPLELGLHPGFRIDPDGREIEEVIRTVVEPATRTAYSSDHDTPLVSAGGLGSGPREIAIALLELITNGVPARALAADPFAPERVARTCEDLTARLASLLELAGGRLRAVTRGPLARHVLSALEATLEFLGQLGVRRPEAASRLCRGLEEIWKPNLVTRLELWGKRDFTKSEAAELEAIAADLAPSSAALAGRLKHLRELDPSATSIHRRALGPLLAECEAALQAAGLTTFNAILHDTRRLFERHPRLLARERRAIHQLLVDEFQDTDVVQCRIVDLLALEGPEDERPGLFVVGDPKQSIYGWRSADLAAYHDFRQKVEAEGGRTYPLVRNFRSAPVLLTAANRAVAPIMREEPGLQPPYIELLPSEATAGTSGFQREKRAPVESWVAWSRNVLESGTVAIGELEAAEIEAAAVARDIEELHAEHDVPWKDCAVLMRSSTRLDVFLEAFRRRAVPFVVTRDKQYFRRREIIEATALVRAVVNPTDQIAFVTFLRSSAVGVPDAALLPLWQQALPRLAIDLGGPRDAEVRAEIEEAVRKSAAELPRDVPGLEPLAGWDENLLFALEALGRLRIAFKSEPADRFVERLRRLALFEPSEAARFLGVYRTANLERFFRRLEMALADRHGNIQAVLRALQRSVSEAQEAEEALPKEAADDAVQVMTIHKAKGLEFPHVYVVQLGAENRQSEVAPTDADRHWEQDGPSDYSLRGTATLDFDLVAARRRVVAAAELVRILYVAMTRARDRLVLCGHWPAEPGASRSGSSPSLLKLLERGPDVPADLGGIATTAVSGPGYADAGGWRWRFPDFSADDGWHPRAEQQVVLPGAPEVLAAARSLADRRTAAAHRSGRPFFRQASELAREASRDARAAPRPDGELPASAAQLAGQAVHRALEAWDFTAPLEQETSLRHREAERWLARVASPADGTDALQRTAELLERLTAGQLLTRLLDEPEAVTARELPVLLPAAEDEESCAAGISGIVDLVLTDTATGRLVIVDYKTDDVTADEKVAERAARYGPQLEVYARALGEALGLDYRPRCELWFLWSDRVWTTSHDADGNALV